MVKKILKFIEKHPNLMAVSWLGFLISHELKAPEELQIILLCFTVVFFLMGFFQYFIKMNEGHKELIRERFETRNSSSHQWDGHVRSDNDLIPRYILLKERMKRDSLELEQIAQRLSYLEKQQTNS